MSIIKLPLCYKCGVPHVPDDVASRVRSGENITIEIISHSGVAGNVLKWGTGAINIDASRVEGTGGGWNGLGDTHRNAYSNQGWSPDGIQRSTQGRWPANLLLSHSVWCVPNGVKKVRANRIGVANPHDRPDHPTYGKYGYTGGSTSYNDFEGMEQVEDWLCDESCPIRLLDEQSGMRKSGGGDKSSNRFPMPRNAYRITHTQPYECEPSEGGASRYFMRFAYIPKASRAERNRGCEGLPEQENRGDWGTFDTRSGSRKEWHPSPQSNTHPTVKPLQLMRYLVRMITPPGGIVLDCFAGSGSTLVAAIYEGMHFIGIEMNDSEQEPYVTIARARIEQAFREVQS